MLGEKHRRVATYLAAAVFALSLCYVGGRAMARGAGDDAPIFYFGSRLLFHGGNPYDPAALHAEWEISRRMGNTHPAPVPFVNPPIVALLVAPAVPFDILPALRVYAIYNFFCLLVCVYFLNRSLPEKTPALTRLGLATWVMMLPPVMKVLSYGQSALFVCAPLAIALYCLKRRSDLWGGFWLALSLAKFTITLPFLLVLLIRGRWKPGLASLFVFGAINLAFTLPIGLGTVLTTYRGSIKAVDGVDGINDPFSPLSWDSQSIVSIKRLFILLLGPHRTPVTIAIFVVTLLFGAVFVYLLRKRPVAEPALDDPLEVAAALMAGLALMYHRIYDLTSLMFVIYALAEYRIRYRHAQPTLWKIAMATLFVLSFFVIGTTWSRPFDFLLALLHLPSSPNFGSVLVFALLVQITIMLARQPTQALTANEAERADATS